MIVWRAETSHQLGTSYELNWTNEVAYKDITHLYIIIKIRIYYYKNERRPLRKYILLLKLTKTTTATALRPTKPNNVYTMVSSVHTESDAIIVQGLDVLLVIFLLFFVEPWNFIHTICGLQPSYFFIFFYISFDIFWYVIYIFLYFFWCLKKIDFVE